MKNTNATDKKLAELRARAREIETGSYYTGVMQDLAALYDEIVETAKAGRG